MTKASFPWLYVITNAVWIFGLAVVLAAFGWHDFLAHTRKRRLGEFLRGDSFLKPLFLGLTLVAGGLALSVSGVILVAGFAVASFGFLYGFVKNASPRAERRLGPMTRDVSGRGWLPGAPLPASATSQRITINIWPKPMPKMRRIAIE